MTLETKKHELFMREALKEAKKAYEEDEIPVGAVIVCNNKVIARGYNQMETLNDATAHAEMIAITSAQNSLGSKYLNDCELYVTLEPCMMCSGTIIQFGIPRVVIGENETFGGNENFLLEHGVDVEIANDSDCKNLMQKFISENPELWAEDIAEEKSS